MQQLEMEHGAVAAALQADAASMCLLLKQTRDDAAAALAAHEQTHVAVVGNFERELEVMRAELAAWRERSITHETDATARSQALHAAQSNCNRLAQELELLQAASAAMTTDAAMWQARARASDEISLNLREESARVVGEQVELQVHGGWLVGRCLRVEHSHPAQ
jgi:hypothetical protein